MEEEIFYTRFKTYGGCVELVISKSEIISQTLQEIRKEIEEITIYQFPTVPGGEGNFVKLDQSLQVIDKHINDNNNQRGLSEQEEQ